MLPSNGKKEPEEETPSVITWESIVPSLEEAFKNSADKTIENSWEQGNKPVEEIFYSVLQEVEDVLYEKSQDMDSQQEQLIFQQMIQWHQEKKIEFMKRWEDEVLNAATAPNSPLIEEKFTEEEHQRCTQSIPKFLSAYINLEKPTNNPNAYQHGYDKKLVLKIGSNKQK